MILLIVGATGSGKSTILQELNLLDKLVVRPTYRDREPRPNENSDSTNIFLSKAEFDKLEFSGYFSHVERYRNNRYGVRLGNGVVPEVSSMSPEGAKALRKELGCVVCKLVCDQKTLISRIMERSVLNDYSAEQRLKDIIEEIGKIDQLDAELTIQTSVAIRKSIREILRYIRANH